MGKQSSSTMAASPVVVFLSRFNKYASFIGRRWWVFLPMIAAGAGLGAWKTSQQAPSFVSQARMMVNGKIALPEGAVYSEELANFYGTQIELMQSAEVRKRAAARVEASRPDLRAWPVSLSVGQQRGTSFFVLTAVGDEPDYTQAFLDACMDEYIQFKRELRSETSDTALTAITDELLKLDKDLQAGEEDLIAFQKKNNVVFLEEEGNSAGRYLVSLKEKLAKERTEFELLRLLDLDQTLARQRDQQPAAAASTDGSRPQTMSSFGPETDYLQAKQQIELLMARRERLGRYLLEAHPKMIQIGNEIEQQEKLIELFRDQSVAQLRTRRESIQLQIQNLETEVKEWETKALDLNQRIAEYNRLKAKVERAKTLSDRLLATIQSVDVNKSLGQDSLTIMERGSAATPTRPDLPKNLATGGAGGLVAAGLILGVMLLLDDRISSSLELQHVFDEEVLAQIPGEASKERLNILKLDDRHHVFSEAFRNLRSSLHFMSFEDHRPKTFLVTSAVPGEGKSTVSVNLAITLAAAGSRTLLVDGDMRRGALNEYFELPITPGFSEVLQGGVSWREAVRNTAQENLQILPRGRTLNRTSEYYLGSVTDDFLRDVHQEYDFVVIDSAPVLAKDDTTSLAPKVDTVLMVARATVSSARLTRTALLALYKRQVNVLGFVLNGAAKSAPDYYYYHKYAEYYAADVPEETTPVS